ncbi:MAG: InlB B-repeat-containing protein [Candidatus Moraniibacteriota bacterium]
MLISQKANAAPDSDSLLGYWKFNGNATDFSGDGTTGGNTGTTASSYVTDSPFANSPQSLTFSGPGSIMTFSDSSNTIPSSALTLSFWVKLTNYPPTATHIIAGNYLASYNKGFFFTIDQNNVSFVIGNGTSAHSVYFPIADIPANTWVLLTGTWNGSTISLYSGNELKSSVAASGPISYASTAFQIGNFTGKMAQMRLYNRALSQEEIATLHVDEHLTATWNGDANPYYEDPSNWTPAFVPDPFTIVTINSGTYQSEFAPGVAESLAGLTINSNASLDLHNSNLTINDSGIFNNNGTLSLDNASDQLLSGFSNDIDSGTIKIDSPTSVTGLKTGSNYYNLTINAAAATTVTLGATTTIHGNLNLENGTLDVAHSSPDYGIILYGNWSSSSATNFNARQGTVSLVGTNQAINGSNIFYNLTKTTSDAVTLTFQAGTTQTISGTLTLQGENLGIPLNTNLLSLRSSTNGSIWSVNPLSSNIGAVNVKDSTNLGTTIIPQGRNINSENNTNWTFDTTPPALSLSAVSSPTSNNLQPVTGTATEADGAATVFAIKFQMDTTGGSWLDCTANDSTFSTTTEAFTCTPETSLSEGQHTMYIKAIDRNDNATAPGGYGTVVFTVDAYHDVIFKNYNGDALKTEAVNHGNAATAPATTPTKTGYTFTGWDIAFTNVTSDLTVTAQFTINTYTVTFDKTSGTTDASPLTKTADYNTSVTSLPTAPTKTGYTFAGWNTATNGSGTAFTTSSSVTGNITVYAQWTINNYTVTFDKTSGTTDASPLTKTADYNTSVTSLPTAPTKTGYTFAGWNTAADGSGNTFTTSSSVTGDITVYAQWTANTHTLTYTAGVNGTITGSASQSINLGTSGTAVSATASANYHFVNWSDGSTANPRTDTNITNDIAVTANFAPNTFTLKYKCEENGKLDGDTTQTIKYKEDGSKVEAKPNTGYKFKKWSDGSDDESRKDEDVDEDLTITAEFEKEEYTLKYEAGSHGSINGDTEQKVKYKEDGEEIVAVPDNDYHFSGWSDGRNERVRTDTDIKKNLTLSASFARDTTPNSDEPETTTPLPTETPIPETTASAKIDYNGETTPNWQNTYFGASFCYDATKCGGAADPDGDGISNSEEFRLGTNPIKSDSDQDGISDKTEIEEGHSPTKSSKNNSDDKIKFEDPKEKGETKKDKYRVDKVELVSLADGKKRLKLTGKGLPNRLVTVYIHSDPIILTVETDADGNWSYTLDKELENGDHEVYVAMTDSSGKISEKSEPLAFIKTAEAVTIIPPAEAASANRAKSPVEAGYQKNLILSIVIGICGLLLAIVTIGFIKHRKNENRIA